MSFGYETRDSVLRSRLDWVSPTTMANERKGTRRAAPSNPFLLASCMYVSLVTIPGVANAQAPEEAPPSAAALTPEPSETNATDRAESTQTTDLRTLEERVSALKERVFRSKARLVLLRETVLNGVISGARATITHRNDMGASFSLVRASYSLDGEPLFNKTDEDGNLDGKSEINLFEGSIVPGPHNLSVMLVYRGNGYGVFSYLEDYKFTIRASYPFTAEEGKLVSVDAVAYEKGGITTDLQERPSVRFETAIQQDVRAAAPDGGAESAP